MNTPEGRMAEASIIKSLATQTKRTNQHNSGTPIQRLSRMIAFGASDCWYWIGSVDALGYGRFAALGEVKAHRAAYRSFNGPIPSGMFVLHRCDTRCCVNPAHLMLGTQADNMRDMAQKGRNKSIPKHGESNPMAKLTAEKVFEIRRRVLAGETQRSMCAEFGVSPMTISRAVRKESWQ